MRTNATFQTVLRVSKRTGAPKAWLKREAAAGRLPSVRVGNRLMMDPQEIETILARRSHGITEAANLTGPAAQGVTK